MLSIINVSLLLLIPVSGFTVSSYRNINNQHPAHPFSTKSVIATNPLPSFQRVVARASSPSGGGDDKEKSESSGVVELSDDDEPATATTSNNEQKGQGPMFISQGELDPQALNPDFSDAKQTRVLIYIILSLLPVLFLIPFMLSRDFIPQDMMPPVDM